MQVFIRLVVYVDQFVARMQGGEIGGTPTGMSGAIYDTVGKRTRKMVLSSNLLFAACVFNKSIKYRSKLLCIDNIGG